MAMQMRFLQTLSDVGAENNTTDCVPDANRAAERISEELLAERRVETHQAEVGRPLPMHCSVRLAVR